MKTWLALWAILFSYLPAQGDTAPSLEDFLTEAEVRAFRSSTQYKQRVKVLHGALGRQSRLLTSLVKQRNLAESMRVLHEMRAAARTGINENTRATEYGAKDLRSKEVKKLEIALRKLVETLDELKLAVPFESRLVFEETADELERFRDLLLNQLFGQHMTSEPSNVFPAAAHALLPSPLPVQSRRRGGASISGDQFTDEEYETIQDAQELKKRVEAFLDIAEARLVEIERRVKGHEWTQEKPNPLEFYTYAQMMHAYRRALEGIMINIDEKARYKLAEPKEIRRSLKLLNEKVQQFIPRLDPIRQLSIELKDEELYEETRSSLKASDNALKGSQFGLGAPARN